MLSLRQSKPLLRPAPTIVMVAVLMVLLLPGAKAAELDTLGHAPVIAAVGERPTLTARLDPVAYRQRRDEALARIDRAELVKTADLQFSLKIVHVSAGGTQAERQGLQVGDQILRIGPHAMEPGSASRFNSLRDRLPVEALIERAPGSLIRVQVAPGRWGIQFLGVHCRLGAVFLAGAEASKPGADDLLIACQMARSDVDVAETALEAAYQAGYRGAIGWAVASSIAFTRCQHEQALALGLRAVDELPAQHAVGIGWQSACLAMISGRLLQAQALAKRFHLEAYFPELQPMIEQVASQSPPTGWPADLAIAAEQRPHLELRSQVNQIAPYNYSEMQRIHDGKSFQMEANEMEEHAETEWGPRIRDGALEVETAFTEPKKGAEQQGNIVIGLNRWPENLPSQTSLLVIERSGAIYLRVNEPKDEQYLGRSEAVAQRKPIRVTFRVIDRIVQVAIDELTVYHLPLQLGSPLAPQARLALSFSFVVQGAEATFTVKSWKSFGQATDDETAAKTRTQEAAALISGITEQNRAARLKQLRLLAPYFDWNIQRILGSELAIAKAWQEAEPELETWATASGDPQAWQQWGISVLLQEPLDAKKVDAVIKRLGREVDDFEPWVANNYHLVLFGYGLRRAGKSAQLIAWMQPLMNKEHVGPGLQLYYAQLTKGDWTGARKTLGELIKRNLLAHWEVHVRLMDAMLATLTKDPLPSLRPIHEQITSGKVPEYFALALAHLTGEQPPAVLQEKSKGLEDGGLWIFYRGLRSFAEHDFAAARNDFSEIVKTFPGSLERYPAEELRQWMTDHGDVPTELPERRMPWPYSPIENAPTPLPVTVPKPGAEDF